MTDRTLTLSITTPEETGDDLAGMTMNVETHGVNEEIAPVLILAAAEALMRAEIRDDMAFQNPMTTGDVLDAMAFLNARLKAVDAIMHLPQAGPFLSMAIEL